jgi:hypothetical protein
MGNWLIQYNLGGTMTTIEQATLFHVEDELEGHEEAIFLMPNTSDNRTICGTIRDVEISYGGSMVFEGELDAVDYTHDQLMCYIYNPDLEVMKKRIMGTAPISWEDVAGTLIAGSIASVSGLTLGLCPTTAVSMELQECTYAYDVFIKLANALEMDAWAKGGTINIGTKGTQLSGTLNTKGLISNRGIDFQKNFDKVYVVGQDIDGETLIGTAGSGSEVLVYRDSNLSSQGALDAAAAKFLLENNTDTSGMRVNALTDVAYNIKSGDWMVVDLPELNLAGTLRVFKTIIGVDRTVLEIERKKPLVEDFFREPVKVEGLDLLKIYPDPDSNSVGYSYIGNAIGRSIFFAANRWWYPRCDWYSWADYDSVQLVSARKNEQIMERFMVFEGDRYNGNFDDPETSGYSCYFDGTYIHFVIAWMPDTGPDEYRLIYRRGEPESDGTLTWSTPTWGTIATIGTASLNNILCPYVTVDTEGQPWVSAIELDDDVLGGSYLPKIWRSDGAGGTWSTKSGYPHTMGTYENWYDQLCCQMTPLNGTMIFAWWYVGPTESGAGSVDADLHVGRLWDGSSWGGTEHPNSYGTASYGASDTPYMTHCKALGGSELFFGWITYDYSGGSFCMQICKRYPAGTWDIDMAYTPVDNINEEHMDFCLATKDDDELVILWATGWTDPMYSLLHRRRDSNGDWSDWVKWFEDSHNYLAYYDQIVEFTHDIDNGWIGVAYLPQYNSWGTYQVAEYLRIYKVY